MSAPAGADDFSEHHAQQHHVNADADDDGHGIDGAAQTHIAAQLRGEGRNGGADGAEGQDDHGLTDLQVKGHHKIEHQRENRRHAVAHQQDPQDLPQLAPIPQAELEAHADHEHGHEGIGTADDARALQDHTGQGDVQQVQQDHQDVGHEGHGPAQSPDDPLEVKALAILHRGGHAEGTAQADEGIAAVEQTGGDDAHGTQEALGKGHGEAADVVARQVQDVKGPLLPGIFPVQQEAQADVDRAAPDAQDQQKQQTRVDLLPGEGGDDGGGQGDADDDLAQNAKILLPEHADFL